MSKKFGVGFIGAGGVVKSIHLPVLARMRDDFHVAAVWDVDPQAASSVAERANAAVMHSLEDILANPDVDVLVVCTPARFHAEHVIKGMKAGKRAVLCEKPLAASLEDADLIQQVAAETGVPLIVGAMHKFDPAWTNVAEDIASLKESAVAVRSSIVLPYNQRFEQWATEPETRPASNSAPPADIRQFMMHMGVMELAIHDLPLVRALVPDTASIKVTSAALVSPFGYEISVEAGDRVLDLFGMVNGSWQPRWELEATSPSSSLHLEFTPSFVQAGSGVAKATKGPRSAVFGPYPASGYEVEWESIRKVLSGEAVQLPSLESVVDDFRFALEIAKQSCALLARETENA